MKRNRNIALVAATILLLGICSIPVSPQAYSALTTTIKNNLKILGGNLSFQTFSATAQGVYGNLMTITVPNPGQATTLTISDPGAATANFVLDKGVLSANLIQHVAVPLTAANIIAMYATPVALIPAGAAGTNIIVHKVMFTMIPSGTAFTAGGAVTFTIGNTANGGGTATTATVAATVVNASGTTTTYNTVIPVSYAGTAATGLYISNATQAFATGTGTAIVDIWYSIH
jgi:hypothetical protein